MNLATKRSAALLIDVIFIGVSAIFLQPVLAVALMNIVSSGGDDFNLLAIIAYPATFVLWPFLYAFICGLTLRSSIGKRLLNLKVYSNASTQMGRLHAGCREMFRVFEVISIFIGLLSLTNLIKGEPTTTDLIFKTTVLEIKFI